MHFCEYCGETFVNITELYRHKYSVHYKYKKSLVLHSHVGSKKGSDSDVDLYNQKQVKSKEVTPLYGKRMWDDSDLEDKHEVKRYKKELKQKLSHVLRFVMTF